MTYPTIVNRIKKNMCYANMSSPITVQAGVVGIKVPGNASPPCVVRYRESSLQATLSITLTPCKSMEGGLAFQGDSHSFHTGPI